jgi:hypothetical protein
MHEDVGDNFRMVLIERETIILRAYDISFN